MAGNSVLARIDYINTKMWRRLSVTRLVESIIDRISLNFILKVGKNWLYLMGLTLLFVLPNSTLFSLEGFEIYIKSKETIEKFTWFVYFCMFGWLVVSLQVLILTFHQIFAFFLNFPVLLSRSWSEIDVSKCSQAADFVVLNSIGDENKKNSNY